MKMLKKMIYLSLNVNIVAKSLNIQNDKYRKIVKTSLIFVRKSVIENTRRRNLFKQNVLSVEKNLL